MDTIATSLARLDAALAEPEPAGSTGSRPGDGTGPRPAGWPTDLDEAAAIDLVTDMLRSRLLDHAARVLRAEGIGNYTISSAGHERTAIVGAHLQRTDPCLLHYRDGALVMAKARTSPDPDHDPVAATIASLVGDRDEPASGGRHKVWGDRDTWIVPQTSTIGSHPPKAVGMAVMLARATRLRTAAGDLAGLPDDAVVVCTVGDASANHATTLSALTAARWAHRHGNPVPVLFVVEDNGRGISVPTPRGWIADSLGSLPGLAFHEADGPVEHAWQVIGSAVDQVRTHRRPAVVRLPTVRIGGHAGSDVETGYRDAASIRTDLERDPLVADTLRLCAAGLLDRDRVRRVLADERARVDALVAGAATRRPHDDPVAVMTPLAPHSPDRVRADASAVATAALRATTPDVGAPTAAGDRVTLAQGIHAALAEQLAGRATTVVFGEDVAVKGGVYGVTKGLQDRFGQARVFDTLLDETTILGTAQGAGLIGLLPIPEIQYLAYLHNALDQVRGEAASTRFFSNGAFTTPMVVRIAGLAYQRGFGGHFHNDNSIGALRDIPGLRIGVPTTASDAVGMLRGACSMAAADGNVVALLEPIALYHERDLHDVGDGGWLTALPGPDHVVLPGEVAVHGSGPDGIDDDPDHDAADDAPTDDAPTDDAAADDASDDRPLVGVVTWGNGVRMARRAARRTAGSARVRVVDLRWIAPLPARAVREAVADCDAVVVADEARATGGGIADAVVADLARHGWSRPLASVASLDSFIPTGPAADTVLLQEDHVVTAIEAVATTAASVTPGAATDRAPALPARTAVQVTDDPAPRTGRDRARFVAPVTTGGARLVRGLVDQVRERLPHATGDDEGEQPPPPQ